MNNARIHCFGGYMPLYDLEEVDAERKIWKGKAVPLKNIITPQNTRVSESEPENFIFFSRAYDPKNNDLDKIFKEIEFVDADILGEPFWLIPKEKVYFGYEPASIIAKPGDGVSIPFSVAKRMGPKKR